MLLRLNTTSPLFNRTRINRYNQLREQKRRKHRHDKPRHGPSGEIFEQFAPWLKFMKESTDSLHDQFYRKGFGGDFGSVDKFSGFGDMTAMTPRIDITESDSAYSLSAELPGMEKKDINITIKDNSLIIEGEYNRTEKKEDDKVHLEERRYGKFYRSIPLPENFNVDKISAKHENGILTITAEKKEPNNGGKQVKID
eukprot:TRINITY_DN2504_c0_g1_i1.p1 TRINITY_DN2504_c0_g1~~TRINITY_DN2504_c0_g1_i1.p1  ORF type:complete len:197 (-),score=39.72 TRINITY_DN2504_c0_g1_i1:37-627(-)